ncbi:MAG: YbjN domain-containing protein [Pseudomonadota bacterium]|nr:YbjN domain-containing protein [Pseudomonadota bacterium]
MALKDTLQALLDELGWEDPIHHDPEDGTDYLSTGYRIAGQAYQLLVISDERRQWLRLVLRAPMTIPAHRRTEAAVLVNHLNGTLGIGHLEASPEGSIAYDHGIDVENAEASPALLKNMLSAAAATFSPARLGALGALAFTHASLEAILADFESDGAGRSSANASLEVH